MVVTGERNFRRNALQHRLPGIFELEKQNKKRKIAIPNGCWSYGELQDEFGKIAPPALIKIPRW